MAKADKLRMYHHLLRDPYVSVCKQAFDGDVNFLSKISIDCLTVKVRKTKERKPNTSNCLVIFGKDAYTGFFLVVQCFDISVKRLVSYLNVLFCK